MRILAKKFIPRLLLGLILISLVAPGAAQTGKLELKNLEKLADKAAEVNDITLDGSLLQLAVRMMENSHDADAAQVRNLVKDLKGIYVKNFEFDSPGQYSQADVEAIRAQLAGPGWQRIVTSRSKRTGENDEIYVLKQGDKINGIAILVAEAKELSVVNIVGAIDPEKLGELGGHFGIPEQIGDHSAKPRLVPRNATKGSTGASEKKESGHEQPMD
jgi:Domain of unknown function (DUF4252)